MLLEEDATKTVNFIIVDNGCNIKGYVFAMQFLIIHSKL